MKQLFCDCKTDEDKSNFFLSGRAVETGVIAPAISNEVAMAYHRCAQLKKENDALRAKIEEMEMEKQEPVQRFVGRRNAQEREPAMQDVLMKFDPATGEERPYPSHATQWRNWHGTAAWLFDPWTGKRRNAYDVGSDVHGLLIAPAGTLGMDMGGGCATTNKGVMKRARRESK